MACGHFSDKAFVLAGKRRDFCRLRRGIRASPTGCQVVPWAGEHG
jgi:hypothetical protein